MKEVRDIKCHNCNEDLYKSQVVARRNEIRFKCYNTMKKIIKCSNCELIQLIPQWSDKELNKIYTKYNSKPDFVGQKTVSKRISKYVADYMFRDEEVLEVGCGSGDNVKYFTKQGYNVVGIDKDPSVADNVNVFHGDIYDKTIKSQYDFIYGLHIFEHMKDPIKFIERLKELLKKRGSILLEFPSIEDPLLTIYKVKEFNKFYFRPDHHFFYTPKTLQDVLYRNKITNCSIERMQNYGIVNHLNWIFRKKPTNIKFNIPIIDNIYKWVLVNIYKKSDTILLTIKKEHK